jgi:hypothetical protein
MVLVFASPEKEWREWELELIAILSYSLLYYKVPDAYVPTLWFVPNPLAISSLLALTFYITYLLPAYYICWVTLE